MSLVEVSANFAFLKQEFPHAAESASYAEHHVYGDPRASCFHARHALERLVKRVYKVEKALSPPNVTNLDAYLSEPAFRAIVPEVVWQKAEYIRQAGNVAVHGNKTPAPEQALNVARELAHVLYWAGRTYLRKGAERLHGKTFDESLVPTLGPGAALASVKELDALKSDLDAAEDARKEIEGELEALRERLAAIKAENAGVPETRDWNESTTRRLIIDLALQRAGWPLDEEHDREYEVRGMPNASGLGYADYVLWGDDGRPLAVVEAKKTTVDAAKGRQQAKLYADCLEAMHGQRPVIFYTNGYETYLWDDRAYAPRAVAGFHKKDELASLLHRRAHREPLDVTRVRDAIVERYYQKRAIRSIGQQFEQARRKALLVMATASGKTRVAVALVDLLQRAGWVKRALFLADRVSLVNQAVGAFKAHLPESSPVKLVTEKDKAGRVYVCTYPTMMGLIDETTGAEARFGVGHFDLVIIDEAHRSVYQKYGAIFRYFDSLLVGLTATPRDQVDRNTYELFDLEPGVPTDVYELATAVADGFLVPPKVQQVDLRFPREGIDYDSLSEEEQAQWESVDWGDDEDGGGLPERVNASAINNWLFNNDTVDKVLQYLMEHGHKVDGGDRLAKTIIFARNHDHATFIEKRFDYHYPRYAGRFARVPRSVRTRGRQARLPRLRLLLQLRLFQRASGGYRGPRRRFTPCPALSVAGAVADPRSGDAGSGPGGSLAGALTTGLHREVAAMNRENFIVRMQLEAVERFGERESWKRLTASDVEILQSEIAGLPSEIETDDIESRLFDLRALKMQLALAEGDTGTFERHRQRVVEIAMLLEEKSTIPVVAAQLAYLASVQESAFWEGIALNGLEELRMRLRGLVPFLTKKTRKVVYTDFQDEITAVREDAAAYLPRMTGVQYEKKVQEYLKNHLDHIVVHRLRTNRPLTATDLRGLEQTLVEIGEDDGQTLLTGLLARHDAPSLAHFVRSMVGMDRTAAQEAFSEFLSNRSLTTPQVRFIEMVIDQLTARGVMEPSALYEAPFSSVHAGGPEALFTGNSNVIEGIFEKLKTLRPETLAETG